MPETNPLISLFKSSERGVPSASDQKLCSLFHLKPGGISIWTPPLIGKLTGLSGWTPLKGGGMLSI